MGQQRTRRHFHFWSVGVTAVFLAVLPTQVTTASVRSTSWTPAPPPAIYDVDAGPNAVRRYDVQRDICTTDAQLDCFESIEAFINGAWVSGTLTGRNGFDGSEWRIPGLVNEDQTDLVEVTLAINYTGNIFHSVVVHGTSVDGFRPPWESGRIGTGCALMNGVCVRYGNLQEGIAFRATYRSSWVLPTALSAKLTDAKVTVEKLATPGATRVTVEGTPLLGQGIADEADVRDPAGKGAWLSRGFDASMVDGRFYPIKKACIEKPTMTIAENGFGSPLPKFVNGQLELNVESAHFRPNGVDKHLGIYEAFIPLETAQCLWGSEITVDSVFAVNVVNPDNGAAKTATPSFQFVNNGFVITAKDYTYSAPTIRVAPLPRPKKPTRVTVSSSRKTITTSFARVKGLKYTATATKGNVVKKLKCKSTKTRVTCSVKNLQKGTWRLAVTPTKGVVKGISYTKRVKVK